MSLVQHLVHPKLPSVLGDQASVDLPGYDLWLHNIDNVHILPALIDLDVFTKALSGALHRYPHAAGQLRCREGQWSIELTNTGVPVDVNYQENTTSDTLLQGDWIIQDDISPFLSQQPIGANLVNGGAPLLRFKVTLLKDETCIGVSWHHTLGDAITLFRFMHTLSQFYQGLSPEFRLPTFKKHVLPPPLESVVAQYRCLMPHLLDTYPFAELENIYAEASKGVDRLSWRLNGDEIQKLRSSLSLDEGSLSIHDCLTAYLVAVLNCNRDMPVRTVTNASSYRNVDAPFIDGDVAGNMLLNVVTDTLPLDMAGIASSIRAAVVRSRDVSYLENWISTASSLMLNSINSGKSFFFAPHEDVMTINSNTAIDWCSVHFGFPDGSRFHTVGTAKYYFRPFRSNPVKGDDGVWLRREGSIDISMGIPTELKPKILKTLADGVEHRLNL